MKKVAPGVICEVTGGALYPSPNLGKLVTVVKYQGEHTLHGSVWQCRLSMPGVTECGVVGHIMDFAEDWLRPLSDEQKLRISKIDAFSI